jgi:hypothetical protein
MWTALLPISTSLSISLTLKLQNPLKLLFFYSVLGFCHFPLHKSWIATLLLDHLTFELFVQFPVVHLRWTGHSAQFLDW